MRADPTSSFRLPLLRQRLRTGDAGAVVSSSVASVRSVSAGAAWGQQDIPVLSFRSCLSHPGWSWSQVGYQASCFDKLICVSDCSFRKVWVGAGFLSCQKDVEAAWLELWSQLKACRRFFSLSLPDSSPVPGFSKVCFDCQLVGPLLASQTRLVFFKFSVFYCVHGAFS